MADTVKKAAPRKAAAKKTAASSESPAATADHSTELALQWLLPRAFPNAQWTHAPSVIEDAGLPQEVVDVLRAAYNRASS